MFDFFKNRRREAIRNEPFPTAWREILERNVAAFWSPLDDEKKRELEYLVHVFLAEKTFEGCGGLELTDVMRVTIAGQACLLLLGHAETDIYPDLETVLVYPHAYNAPTTRQEGMVVIESVEPRLGESWTRGIVVIAWDHARASGMSLGGSNVVLHEFAHQLDAEDGDMDGAPALGSRARFASWAHVLGDEFKELSDRLHAGRDSDIDAYGATSPPEFFAVVTEMFFEKPRQLRTRHPELYAELAAFYKQDPAETHPHAH